MTSRIFLVDDQSLVRAGFRMVLDAQPDMTVVGEAPDGQSAVDQLKTIAADVVLMDIRMPRMDGISLTKKLRETPQFKTTPILMLTTESSDQMKQAGRAAGATGWLVKPFDPAKLIEVIGKVIR